jgi:transcriptional regulator with XRE-family HTH domain
MSEAVSVRPLRKGTRVFFCPPEHRHGGALTCYQRHGCRCDECRANGRRNYLAKANFERKLRAVSGRDVLVPAVGSVRRLQALALNGWTLPEVAERTGFSRGGLSDIRCGRKAWVRLSTHKRLKRFYESVWDQIIDTPHALIAVSWAKRQGFVPGLAWDDIDRDVEPPSQVVELPDRRTIDYVAVERLWREGLSDRQIAERLGCSGAGVQRARKRMGWETKWAA